MEKDTRIELTEERVREIVREELESAAKDVRRRRAALDRRLKGQILR